MNIDDSPWFHVHFTLPNHTTKRRLISYEGPQRRRTSTLQAKNDSAFLKAESKKANRKNKLDKRGIIQKQKHREDKLCKILDKAGKLSDNNQNGLFIESSKEAIIEKKLTLPPLTDGFVSVIGCQGQQSTVTPGPPASHSDIPDKPLSAKTDNRISIATCYDLYEWKPMSSIVGSIRSRPLASILKHNTQRRHKGQIVDHSDTSGYDTDHDAPSKTTKKVRFAKGTVFRSSKGRRQQRSCTRPRDTHSDEDEWKGLDGLTFSEFIQRKRCDRTQSSKNTLYKTSNNFKFLKNNSLDSKRKITSQRCHRNDVLPTIIN